MQIHTSSIRSLIYAGSNHFEQSHPLRSRCIATNIISGIVIFSGVTLGMPLSFICNSPAIFFGVLVGIALSGCSVFLNHLRRHDAAGSVLFAVLNGGTLYFGMILGKGVHVELITFCLILLDVFLFYRPRHLVLSILTALAILTILKLNYKEQFIKPFEYYYFVQTYVYRVAFCIAVIAVALSCSLLVKIKGAMMQQHQNFKILHESFKALEQNFATLKNAYEKEAMSNQAKGLVFIKSFHDARSSFAGLRHIARAVHSIVLEKGEHPEVKAVADQLNFNIEVYKSSLDNMLNLAKLDATIKDVIRLEKVNIRNFIDGIMEYNEYLILEKKLSLDIHISDNVPKIIHIDNIRLNEICMNLLLNAVKFSDPGKALIIRFFKAEHEWHLQIEDQGIGIAEEDLQRIFEPFETKRDSIYNPQGIGMGLSITAHIAKLMGGNVTVKSKQGKGSCFTVTIPIQQIAV